MLCRTGLNPIDEFDNQLKEKVNKAELDRRDELKLKRETLEKIKNILKIPKGTKSNEDLKFLFQHFINSKFFSTGIEFYGENTLINLLDCCNVIEVAANEIIINFGDKVNSAFILVSGNIKISSLKQKINENPEDKVRFKISDKINRILNLFLYKTLKNVHGHTEYNIEQTMEMLLANNVRFSKPKQKKTFNIEDDWCVDLGEMFGDKYLIERKISSLSYVTTKKTVLLEVKKKDFYNLLESIRKEEYLKELKFFHSINVFSNFSRNAIERLKLNLKEKKYFNGELVIEQNQLINDVFVVKSGSFRVTYKYSKNIVNEFDLNYYTNITPLDFRFTENRKHEIKGYKKTQENLKLLTVEKGQFIGDLEFIQNREKSYFTVTCTHEGSVLIYLPKIIFDKYVRDQKDDFYEFTKERENYYKERFKKLSAISKAICFDNPETKYLKDLIIRIKDGMLFMRKQEAKKQSRSRTKNENDVLKKSHSKNSRDSSNDKTDNGNKANANTKNIRKIPHQENTPKKDSADEFLKNYNRTGDYNEKLKRIKRKIIKRDSIDSNFEIKSQEKQIRYNSRNKSALPLHNDPTGTEAQKKEEDGYNSIQNKKSNDLFSKSSEKMNKNNSANFNSNKIKKINDSKNDSQNHSIAAPKKVIELFSRLKNNSNFYKDKDANKNDSAANTSNSFLSSLLRESKIASNKDVKDIKENLDEPNIIKSVVKNENQEKNKFTLNHSSSSFNKKINESNSRINSKMTKVISDKDKDKDKDDKENEKRGFYRKGLMMKNRYLITHKMKIKKINLEDWKKENFNSLDNSAQLSLNTERKKETPNKFESCNRNKNFSDWIQIKKRASTPFYTFNKTIDIKSDEKIKINEKLIVNANNNNNDKNLRDQRPSTSYNSKLDFYIKNIENKSNSEDNNSNNNVDNDYLKLNANNSNPNNIDICLVEGSIYGKIQEQPPEETKMILNTINREIGEFNNDLYIIEDKNTKAKKENFEEKEVAKRISKNPFVKNINEKSCSTIYLNQIPGRECEYNTLKLNENPNPLYEKAEEPKEQINKFIKLKVQRKAENNLKRGVSSELGNSKDLNNIEIKDIWNKRKTEIFRNIEAKINGGQTNKLSMKSTKIKPNLAMKKDLSADKKQLYYSNKNPNLSKTKYETPDLKMNISVFVNENFEKEKSIFKINRNKDLLQTFEISKSIYLNSNKISYILNSKYDYLKNHCAEKRVEKSINLRKKD